MLIVGIRLNVDGNRDVLPSTVRRSLLLLILALVGVWLTSFTTQVAGQSSANSPGLANCIKPAYSFRKSKSQYLHIEDSLQSRRDCCFCWNPSKYWGHPSPIVNNELQFYRHGPGGFAYTSRSWVQLLYAVYKLPDSGWTVHDRRDCKLVYR